MSAPAREGDVVAGDKHGQRREKGRWGSQVLVIASLAAVFVIFFVYGYLPRRALDSQLEAEVKHRGQPIVSAAVAARSPAVTELVLPGSIQAITEAPIIARCWNDPCRSNGYLRRRYVDIGDRVSAGQVMGEIEVTDLDQQIRQARATVDQSRAGLANAEASLAEARANADLAKVTADRWQRLVAGGLVSVQEADQTLASYRALSAKALAAEASVNAARENVRASEANLNRLNEWLGYGKIRAPFAGVVTERNVDVGSLIDAASTVMFRVAQIGVLRIFVRVPQSAAPGIQVGQPAEIAVREFAGRAFVGKVSRTANALDPNSRTLLTEVQLANPDQVVLTGMYAEVRMRSERAQPPIMIPGDAVVVRADGVFVAVVHREGNVHFQRVQLGHDHGREVEVVSGLDDGQQVIRHPPDEVSEGVMVQVEADAPKGDHAPTRRSTGATPGVAGR